MEPDTSHSENPIKAHRTKLLLINGLRAIDCNKKENINPTPTATPANTISGILEDR